LTGARSESRPSFQLNSSLLADSAFCELETDSVTWKSVTHLDQVRLLRTAGEGNSRHCYWPENLPNISHEHCQSRTSINSQSVVESSSSDGCADSSSIEEFEISDTESQGHSAECDSSSSVIELSSSCSLSDTSNTFLVRDGAYNNEQVADDSMSSDGDQHTNMDVVSPSNASGGNESQLQQHRPLVFFLVGLFVGLSLGFFTCEYATDAM